MIVSSYQIHNVLNLYSKQLSRGRSTRSLKSGNNKQQSDHIDLSNEGKRKATIEKVAQDILTKISRYGSNEKMLAKEQNLARDDVRRHIEPEPDNKKETAFVFNVIDHFNNKTTNALSVKDTNFLINRLEQLAQDADEEEAGS